MLRTLQSIHSSAHFIYPAACIVAFRVVYRKDAKKVAKLQAQIPYHHGRGNKDEVAKIEQQIADIWVRTREAAFAMDWLNTPVQHLYTIHIAGKTLEFV